MSTLTGVIKASTKLGTDVVPAESDLYVLVDFTILSTPPYPFMGADKVSGNFDIDVELNPPPRGISATGLANIKLKAKMVNTVEYGEFIQPLSEAAGLTNVALKAKLVNTVIYGEYRHPLPEATGLVNVGLKAKLENVIIDPNVPPMGVNGLLNVEVELV